MKQQTEQWIVRALDGELTEDEQLALQRELIRNPEARQLMEEYKNIDESSRQALCAALGRDEHPLDTSTLPARTVTRLGHGLHRGWWLAPGAVAAALLGVLVARFPMESLRPGTEPRHAADTWAIPTAIGNRQGPVEGVMWNAGTQAPDFRIRRNTGRDVLGVVGEDGNIYWIEVDRIQTIKQPGSGAQTVPADRSL